jgi:hypothetical protein
MSRIVRVFTFRKRKKYRWTAKRRAAARIRAYRRFRGNCLFCHAPVLTDDYVMLEVGRYNKYLAIAHRRCVR